MTAEAFPFRRDSLLNLVSNSMHSESKSQRFVDISLLKSRDNFCRPPPLMLFLSPAEFSGFHSLLCRPTPTSSRHIFFFSSYNAPTFVTSVGQLVEFRVFPFFQANDQVVIQNGASPRKHGCLPLQKSTRVDDRRYHALARPRPRGAISRCTPSSARAQSEIVFVLTNLLAGNENRDREV